MVSTTAVIQATNAGSDLIQKTITHINPEASDTSIVSFAQGLMGLTDNTYVDTIRVDKKKLSEVVSNG